MPVLVHPAETQKVLAPRLQKDWVDWTVGKQSIKMQWKQKTKQCECIQDAYTRKLTTYHSQPSRWQGLLHLGRPRWRRLYLFLCVCVSSWRLSPQKVYSCVGFGQQALQSFVSFQTQKSWYLIWLLGTTFSNKIGHGSTFCEEHFRDSRYPKRFHTVQDAGFIDEQFDENTLGNQNKSCLRWKQNIDLHLLVCTSQNLRVGVHQSRHVLLKPATTNWQSLEISPRSSTDMCLYFWVWFQSIRC